MEIDQKKIQDMIQSGLQYGHRRSKTHPKAAPFILSTKNNIEIINLETTFFKLEEAKEAVKNVLDKKGLVLFVGAFPTSREAIKSIADDLSQPYVLNRWTGGLLTNFKSVSDRIKYYLDLKQKFENNELTKYTKKEQKNLEKELGKLEIKFGGLARLTRKPDLVFVVDPGFNKTAVLEAKRSKIPVIAILDNDDNPTLVNYAIPANDSSISSISWILNDIKSGIKVTNTVN